MHLVPALTVLNAQRGMIVQQTLCDLCLALACYRYIQWGNATPITIIWRGAQLKQSAAKEIKECYVYRLLAVK